MRVNIHTNEVQNALELLSIPYQLFTSVESEVIHANFCARYAQNQSYTYPLWDHVEKTNTFSVQNSEAWTWLESLLEGKKIWLLFEKKEDQQVFEIENGEKLTAILGECYLFTFYLTDSDLSFFFSFNDHEILTAGGTALAVLQKYYLKLEAQKIMDLLAQENLDLAVLEQQTQDFLAGLRKCI